MIPGPASGSVTPRNVATLPAPKSLLASRIRTSMRSRATKSGRIMKPR